MIFTMAVPIRWSSMSVKLVGLVSRTRCGILHAAPQSRDRYGCNGPGSAAHRFASATRCAASGEQETLCPHGLRAGGAELYARPLQVLRHARQQRLAVGHRVVELLQRDIEGR